MKLKTYEGMYSLESFLAGQGYSHQLWNIVELTRQELLDKYKKESKAQEKVLETWNNLVDVKDNFHPEMKGHPTVKEHRISYFLMWHLVKELEVRPEI